VGSFQTEGQRAISRSISIKARRNEFTNPPRPFGCYELRDLRYHQACTGLYGIGGVGGGAITGT
jgi:hypothetical protein